MTNTRWLPHFVSKGFVTSLYFARCFLFPVCGREYWPAIRSTWALSLVFSPLQYLTFRYLPLELRVLSVNASDAVWTFVLSYFSHRGVSKGHPVKSWKGQGPAGVSKTCGTRQHWNCGQRGFSWQAAKISELLNRLAWYTGIQSYQTHIEHVGALLKLSLLFYASQSFWL